MALNFVKFLRGSKDAYNALVSKNAVDLNTLYFLYDPTNPTAGGELRVGYTIISDTTTSSSAVTNLNNLSDISINSPLSDGMILLYNDLSKKWENHSIREVIEDAGVELSENNVTVQNELEEELSIEDYLTSIINPKAGDIAIIAGQPFIYNKIDENNGNWISLIDSSVLENISTLEELINSLNTTILTVRSEIDSKIAAANHLTFHPLPVGQGLLDIDLSSANINRTVFLIPNNGNDENNKYDEYMYVNNQFEKIGNWSTDLANYVTTSNFNSTVSNILSLIDNLQYVSTVKYNTEVGAIADLLAATNKQNTTVIEELVDIYERLQWTDINDN